MKAPAFWQDRTPGALARLLLPFGALYGALTARRMARRGARADVPVICIGNFTAGGAGKTPTAIALAAALQARGEMPVFLSRGYGGSLTEPVRVDPAAHTAAMVGDEPLLLAAHAPTVVAADRAKGAARAATLGSVIVMDDGMQNPALAKDFTLAVIDGAAGFGNGLCLPAGPLRAPVEAQMGHVDALLVIGLGGGITEAVALGADAGKPVYRANLTADAETAEWLAGRRVIAFAGIGRPQKFFEMLLGFYAKLDGVYPFADHHPYSEADAAMLRAAAEGRQVAIVTTDKDRVRLTGGPERAALADKVRVIPAVLPLPEEIVDLAMGAIRRARVRA